MAKPIKERYLDSLNARIQNAPNPEEKGRLEQLKEYFLSIFKPN
jgi:hypothetical protein